MHLGVHPQNDKAYTSTVSGTSISSAEDEDLFRTPIDVYGRVSVGFRLFNQDGLAQKKAYEKAYQEELEQQREWFLQQSSELISPKNLDLEARRLRHRLKNGNG